MTRQLWPGLFLFTPIADDYKQLKVQHLPQTSEDGDGGAYFAPLDAAVVFGRKPDGFGDLLLGKFFVLTGAFDLGADVFLHGIPSRHYFSGKGWMLNT